jgi:DNA-binding CsgD family transcriptional regulator
MAVPTEQILLERERELEVARGQLERAAGGEGSLLAIVGPAGIGKTRLIAAIRKIAEEHGCRILTARGSELEGEFPFGVARQLLEPLVAGATADRRAELLAGAAGLAGAVLGQEVDRPAGVSTDPTFAALHGLYWVAANLTAEEQALFAIDDAQWADMESIRWLEYLMHRLEGLPLLVVLGVRLGEPGTRAATIDAIAADSAATVIEPSPLSEEAVTELTRVSFGLAPEPEFANSCHRATGGNPFLLTELLTTLAYEGVEPVAASGPRALATSPGAVTRSVLARLARLPLACRTLARTLAIAGDGTDLGTLRQLSGLGRDSAAEAADMLVASGIIAPANPPEFRHPMLRTAIYDDIAPFERAKLHARAARLLAESDADPGRIATQLMVCEPAADEWATDRLREAAHAALAKGSPQTAAELLRRALAEPPPERDRQQLLTELGLAEGLSHQEPEAIEHLTKALELTEEPLVRAVVSRSLGTALVVEGRAAEGVALLERAIADLPDQARELGLRIEADIACLGYFSYDAYRLASARSLGELDVDPGEPGARPALGALAGDVVQRGGPVADAARLAHEACGQGRLLREEGPDMPPFYLAANALTASDELEAALSELTAGMEMAAERGSRRGMSLMAAYRAVAQVRRGAVAQAEADARAYLDLGQEAVLFGLPPALSSLVWALRERGDLDAAESALAANPAVEKVSEQYDYVYVVFQRARLRIAQGRPGDALEDLRFCGRHEEAYGIQTPAATSWRSDAALCLAALGENGEAAELVAEEVSTARTFGAPRPLGIALRAAALLEVGERRVEQLEKAADILAASPDRLEHARALTDLGSALRHQRRPANARAPLREALAMARRCGATALAERAHTEFTSTGARPRKIVRGGIEALTPSEVRVAELAASGRSNRQIAEALFVTVKTVETHLNRVYRKLEIGSRSELKAALRPE